MSLTNTEKRYGIILKSNENGELKKYNKSGRNYKKVCNNEGCVMTAHDGTYCCNFIKYNKCKMNNNGELTYIEKSSGGLLSKTPDSNIYIYINI
jgi:hypothetical protein